jgi:hypothetical protein
MGSSQNLPESKRAKIIAALKVNPNAAQVARQIGDVGRVTVWNIAKREGIALTAGKAAQGGGKKSLLSVPKCAEIIAALKANPNATQVARQIGDVSSQTVCKIAKRAGIELTAGKAASEGGLRPPLSLTKREKIIAALKVNPNAAEVARQIGGVSRVTVLRIAKSAGIELTAGKAARGGYHQRLSLTKRAKIIAALKINPNATEVARQIGNVSQRTVWDIAKKAGIELTAGKAAMGFPAENKEKRAEIIAALKVNPNARQVARQIGDVSHGTVWNIAKRARVELARRRGRGVGGKRKPPDSL